MEQRDRKGRVAAAGGQGSGRGPGVARGGPLGCGATGRGRRGGLDLRGHRRRVARRRRGGTHRPAPRARQAVQPDDRRGLPALVPPLPAARVRPDGRRRDQRDRVADVGRPPEPRGSVAVANRGVRVRCLGDLRLGNEPCRADTRRATHCAWSSCRRTTRSRACAWRSRRRRRHCSRRSTSATPSPTRSRSTQGLRRSEIYRLEWPEVLEKTRSPAACSSRAPRARRAGSAARRSPSHSACSSRRPGSASAVLRAVLSASAA